MSDHYESGDMILLEQGFEMLGTDSYGRGSANNLSHYSPEQVVAVAQALGELADVGVAAMNTTAHIASCLSEALVISQKIDGMVKQYQIDAQRSVEQMKAKMPIMERQIDRQADAIDRLLDKVLDIPVDTGDENVLRSRALFVDLLTRKNDRLQDLLLEVLRF